LLAPLALTTFVELVLPVILPYALIRLVIGLLERRLRAG